MNLATLSARSCDLFVQSDSELLVRLFVGGRGNEIAPSDQFTTESVRGGNRFVRPDLEIFVG